MSRRRIVRAIRASDGLQLWRLETGRSVLYTERFGDDASPRGESIWCARARDVGSVEPPTWRPPGRALPCRT